MQELVVKGLTLHDHTRKYQLSEKEKKMGLAGFGSCISIITLAIHLISKRHALI